jgi:hypothetical protein
VLAVALNALDAFQTKKEAKANGKSAINERERAILKFLQGRLTKKAA